MATCTHRECLFDQRSRRIQVARLELHGALLECIARVITRCLGLVRQLSERRFECGTGLLRLAHLRVDPVGEEVDLAIGRRRGQQRLGIPGGRLGLALLQARDAKVQPVAPGAEPLLDGLTEVPLGGFRVTVQQCDLTETGRRVGEVRLQ